MHGEELTWGGFDGPKFQRFCNALIHYYVSKRANLYTAPGRDGGIDQYFDGQWDKYKGKFRFQDKFHGGVDRKTGFRLLKRDLKKDIKDHANTEDIIVYITDISLNDKELRELEGIAKTALLKVKKTELPEVIIWHGGILDTKVRLAPILWNQFFDTSNLLLEDYHEYFKPQLSSPYDRFQLVNPFYGRIGVLAELKTFLKGPDTTAVLTGIGNMGKTRAVLHFFQTDVDSDDDWIVRVLKPEGYTAAGFANLMIDNRKLIILLDDAHKHLNEISSVKSEIDKRGGQVKLIMTCRGDRFEDLKLALSSHARHFRQITIQRLDPNETKEVFKSLLPAQSEPNILWLRNKSSGVPGVIVAQCSLIRAGHHPQDIPEDQVFKDYVTEALKETTAAVEAKTYLDKRKIRTLVETISLLAPVPNSQTSIEALAEISGLPLGEIEEMLVALAESGFIIRMPEIAIKPDPVSDTILREYYKRAAGTIKHLVRHPKAASFFGNLVDNLTVFQIEGGDHSSFVKGLLTEYTNQITDPGVDKQTIESIFDTASRLALVMPEVGMQAIEKFLTIYSDKSHPLHNPGQWASQSPLEKLRGDMGKLMGRLFRTAHDETSLPLFFPLFRQCIKVLDQDSLVYPCFSYSEYDFDSSRLRHGPCCYRQLFLIDKISPFFTSDDDDEVALALAGFECLYKVDYQLEETYDSLTGQFTYGQGFIQDCDHIRKVRLSLLDGLIAFHRKHRHDPNKTAHWMHELARGLIYQFTIKPKRSSRTQAAPEIQKPKQAGPTVNLTEELYMVCNYFKELLNGDITIAERAEIGRYNSIGELRELKAQFKDLHEGLTKALMPGSLDQRLEFFLSGGNYRTEESVSTLQRLLEEYGNPEQFVLAIKRMLSENASFKIAPLNTLAHYLGQHHLEEAKDIIAYVTEHAPIYAGVFSTILDYLLHDDEAYYAAVNRILAIDKKYNPKVVIVGMMLSDRRITENALKLKDLEYIAEAVDDPEVIQLRQADFQLYHYADIDPDKTFDLLKRYAAKHEYTSPGDMIFSIVSDSEFCKRHCDRILTLLKYLLKYCEALNGHFQPGLHFIMKEFGDQALFEFVVDDVRNRSEIDYYSSIRGVYRDNRTYEGRCQLFKSFVNWLRDYPHPLKDYIKKDLLSFFLPPRPIDDEERDIFDRFFATMMDDLTDMEVFEQVAVAIRGDIPYDERSLLLQCRLIDRVFSLYPGFSNVDRLIGSNYVSNHVSNKNSIARGTPYIEDKAKKVFLEQFLHDHISSEAVGSSLRRALKQVEKDIDDASKPVSWQG